MSTMRPAQVNTRVLMDEIKVKKPAATLDDFPEAELDRIAGEGYDFLYFLGVWQTGEFGMKKSIKLLDLEPCMKVRRNHPPPPRGAEGDQPSILSCLSLPSSPAHPARCPVPSRLQRVRGVARLSARPRCTTCNPEPQTAKP